MTSTGTINHQMDRIGFVGLGVMGAPMAGHLVQAGFRTVVWNRTPSKAEPLAEKGASVAPSIEALGAESSIVFTCVNRTEDVRECLSKLTSSARPGTLFVDHSTISAKAARDFHSEMESRGFAFIDAPITGGSMGAQKGQLTIFCGGSVAHIEAAMPALNAYAKRAERVGGPGAGQMMKLANQIAVGGALLALCESLSFAQKAGLDLAQARDMLSGGAAGSWAFDNYGPKILAADWSPGFTVKNQRKDFGYCEEAAREIDAAIPGTLLADRLLEELEQRGHADWTTAALYEELVRRGFDDN